MQEAKLIKQQSRQWLEYKGLAVDDDQPVMVKVDLRKLVQAKQQVEKIKADLARVEFERLFR